MTTISNAGPPPRDEPQPLSGARTAHDWSYRVEQEPSAPGREPALSFGSYDHDLRTTDELAAYVAGRNRADFPYYRGSLTVWVWPTRADEHYRLPVPPGTPAITYPPGEPSDPMSRWRASIIDAVPSIEHLPGEPSDPMAPDSSFPAVADPSWYLRVLHVLARDYPQTSQTVWERAIGENAEHQVERRRAQQHAAERQADGA